MTRRKAWIAAATVTSLVVLFLLAAGASFGAFGLGGSDSRADAVTSSDDWSGQQRAAFDRSYGETAQYGEDDDENDRDDEDQDHEDEEHGREDEDHEDEHEEDDD